MAKSTRNVKMTTQHTVLDKNYLYTEFIEEEGCFKNKKSIVLWRISKYEHLLINYPYMLSILITDHSYFVFFFVFYIRLNFQTKASTTKIIHNETLANDVIHTDWNSKYNLAKQYCSAQWKKNT